MNSWLPKALITACLFTRMMNGRNFLPSVLREFAGLEKDVVLVGVASRIEIWSKDRWLQSISTYDDDMDEVAANMESLGFSI